MERRVAGLRHAREVKQNKRKVKQGRRRGGGLPFSLISRCREQGGKIDHMTTDDALTSSAVSVTPRPRSAATTSTLAPTTAACRAV